MQTEVRLLQDSKAQSPIEMTEFGIVIEVKPSQLEKAYSPIEMTEFGIVTEVNPLQSVNAWAVMEIVPSLMAIDVAEGIVPLYLYNTLLIYINPSGLFLYHGVSSKVFEPIEMTEFGIEIEVKLSHS